MRPGKTSRTTTRTSLPRRRHVRVRAATACFAAGAGGHVAEVETGLGATAGSVTPDGETSLRAVRCLGYCYAGPAALDGDTPRTGPDLAGQLTGRVSPRAVPDIPAADATGDPVLLGGVVAGEPAWQPEAGATPDGPHGFRRRAGMMRASAGRSGGGQTLEFCRSDSWECRSMIS
ncbi:NAD(P)H-dependent oxidoreductase subunit E [Streptomyces sp. NPDC021098]|uniref:NAD(P)H-dependent oxidoreductase subunit E n=1 Tax=unclassified Streptomyces TaxID=2593676 RepID=UPI003798DD33